MTSSLRSLTGHLKEKMKEIKQQRRAGTNALTSDDDEEVEEEDYESDLRGKKLSLDEEPSEKLTVKPQELTRDMIDHLQKIAKH